MSFQKVKSLIQIVTAIQKSPDFFAGILVGLLFAIYLLSTDVIYDNFQSAYGNTKVTGLGRVCKNYPKTLAFTTVANRRERVGTFFVARIDYCNLERFLVSGTFFDSEYSGKDRCEGDFYIQSSNRDAFVTFVVGDESSCEDAGNVFGINLYKKISVFQSYLFKFQEFFY